MAEKKKSVDGQKKKEHTQPTFFVEGASVSYIPTRIMSKPKNPDPKIPLNIEKPQIDMNIQKGKSEKTAENIQNINVSEKKVRSTKKTKKHNKKQIKKKKVQNELKAYFSLIASQTRNQIAGLQNVFSTFYDSDSSESNQSFTNSPIPIVNSPELTNTPEKNVNTPAEDINKSISECSNSDSDNDSGSTESETEKAVKSIQQSSDDDFENVS